MAIALSQDDYWTLFQESAVDRDVASTADQLDITRKYSSQWGHGFMREICLREGLTLDIANYQPRRYHHPFCRPRTSLEYSFNLPDGYPSSADAIPYHLFGSGIAPGGREKQYANQRIMWVSVHIEPEVFRSFAGNPSGQVPEALQHLIGDPNQKYYVRPGQATPAMHIALQQILQCPYQGFTQRMFLESKVWELMALLLEQEAETQQGRQPVVWLKPDDVDRIHQAKAILLQHLNNPPSLTQLARQAGLNECTLKLGFRQVFGTTAFSYLHHYRLEQARQLLTTDEMSVTQVAQSIGFARNYFTKAFRQKFGCTPLAYRKGHRVHFNIK